MDLLEVGHKLALRFLPFLIAISLHEYGQALMAKWFGDDTAERAGRLTVNPMAHADLTGTFILPIISIVFSPVPFLFGWAKPVPVDARNVKNYRTGMFWIAFAGPLMNLFLAALATLILFMSIRFSVLGSNLEAVTKLTASFVVINLSLAFFNLIPLHPLDGGKVLARFLPASINYKLEQNEHISGFILLALVFSGLLGIVLFPIIGFFYNLFIQVIQSGAI